MSAKLAAKLAEVMAAVNRIPKRGRNDFHKYDYATEADIAEAVRKELSQRGVVLIPSVEAVEHRDLGVKKNGDPKEPLTILHMRFTFYDGESGESIASSWVGVGQDGGDKGAYKAMTGAAKYFLMKSFLMPTGDDPEAEKGTNAPKVEVSAPTTPRPFVPEGAVLLAKVEQDETSAGKVFFRIVTDTGETFMTWSESAGKAAEQACQNGEPVRVQVRGSFEDMAVVKSLTVAKPPAPPDELMAVAQAFSKTPSNERGF